MENVDRSELSEMQKSLALAADHLSAASAKLAASAALAKSSSTAMARLFSDHSMPVANSALLVADTVHQLQMK